VVKSEYMCAEDEDEELGVEGGGEKFCSLCCHFVRASAAQARKRVVIDLANATRMC
jgi:hypothetical protein